MQQLQQEQQKLEKQKKKNQLFKAFTNQSLKDIEIRREHEREIQEAAREKNPPQTEVKRVCGCIKRKKVIKHDEDDDEPKLKPSKEFMAGNTLPSAYKNKLPVELIGKPMEEIDEYYKNDYTFVVINKGYTIYRFSAKRALFLLGPDNFIRKLAIFILTHGVFSAIVITTILLNCVFMALPPEYTPEVTEIIFTVVYTFEALIKILARGFIIDKFSFLRDAWNWLDFVVISSAYLTMLVKNLGNMSVLRTLRVLRALKTVAIVPGLKTIVDALIQSVVRLRDVMILTCFVLSIFSLVGMQLYMGVLRRKCVNDGPSNMTDIEYINYVNNEENWKPDPLTGGPILCGNGTHTRRCDNSSTCLIAGDNPNYGYTSFDSYGYAMLSAFRLMTQDFWENLYAIILTTEGPFHVFFFILVIFFGSFYLINLILAIVAMSYKEQQEKNAAEAAALEAERLKAEQDELNELMENADETNKEIMLLDNQIESCSMNRSPSLSDKKSPTHEDLNFVSNRSYFLSPTMQNIDQQLNNSSNQTWAYYRKGSSSTAITWNYAFTDYGEKQLQLQQQQQHQQQNDPLMAIPYIDETTNSSITRGSYKDNKLNGTRLNGIGKPCDQIHEEELFLHVPGVNGAVNDRVSVNISTSHAQNNEPKTKLSKIFGILCCTWDCCPCFETFRKYIGYFILDPFTDLFVLLCILLNTLFMAMDHHDMSPTFAYVLSTGNYIFTAIFAIEAFCKIITLSPSKYFKDTWNCFDMFIVTLSLIELLLSGIKGLSVLRSFRLLRVFKLAKSWATLNRLMIIIGQTLGALGNLTFVLGIVIFIFAVVGMQLFGESYTKNQEKLGGLPRWNFVDFFHSFLIVFRVLCGEWIESMWDCMEVSGISCVPFFLCTKIIGGLVVLNLFLALLLSAFGADSFKQSDGEEDVNNIQEAFNRIQRFTKWCKTLIKKCFRGMIGICSCKKKKFQNNNYQALSLHQINQNSLVIHSDEELLSPVISTDAKIYTPEINNVIDFDEDIKDLPPDCFSDLCHARLSACWPFKFICNNKSLMRKWTKIRCFTYKLIEHKYFESFIILMILLSSIALALEDKHIKDRPTLKKILEVGDTLFTYIFLAEMILKWFAYGFSKYFSDGWCWIDFFIVSISMIGIFVSLLGYDNIQAFKIMRTLRALRPLRALSRFEGIRIVVNALIGSIPAIINVMLVCLIFWLIFSIMGVQLFAGKFYKCVYPNNSRLMPHDEVANKTQCLEHGFVWQNSKVNFDNVLNAYVALFQVATYKGWIEIFADAADIPSDLDQQPRKEQSLGFLMYFVIFIIFGSFFTLNLFIGVIIDNFNQQKKKLAADGKDLFLTESQKKYLKQMKKIGNKKPQKALPRPSFWLSRVFFDITSSQKFDIFIMACIMLNMMSMCVEHYDQSAEFDRYLAYVNYVFIVIFTAECTMKMIALHWRFFKIPWNVFDLFIVIISILGVASEEFLKHILFFSPTILRVLRVIRVGRILRLVKGARGIRTLLFSLAISMPALVNIGLLLFLVIFIYAIFGMNMFMNVSYGLYITELFNFETIWQSIITLFPLTTSANWATVLEGVSIDLPKCGYNVTINKTINYDCGNNTVAIPFLVSYLIFTFLVVVNMYIAVILENFSEAREEVQQGLTDDDYDMYYDHWKSYDPKGTEFISYDRLSEFIDTLEEPLRIPRPNRLKLVSMDLVICENDRVHCMDILDALTKNFLGAAEEVESDILEDVAKIKERPKTYVPIETTLERARKNYCAKVITRFMRKCAETKQDEKIKRQMKESSIAHVEDTTNI